MLQSCETAAKTGNPHFIFDREREPTPAGSGAKTGTASKSRPWKMRLALIQNVTINLARAGFLAGKNDAKLFSAIDNILELAARAHIEKAQFMEKLLDEAHGPLSFLTINRDGDPYLKMKTAIYFTGTIGLSELCLIHTGSRLGKDGQALDFCTKVMNFIKKRTETLVKETRCSASVRPDALRECFIQVREAGFEKVRP